MNIKRVLFLDIFSKDSFIAENVGQASIAAFLNENGYSAEIFAFKEDVIDYNRFMSFKPDIIGFSIQQQTIKIVDNVSKHLKQNLPEVYMLLGGYMPTYNTDQLLNELSAVDFIVRGEGELTTLRLLNALNGTKEINNVAGISYRNKNKNIHNADAEMIKDLDILPFPLRTTMQDYNLHSARIDSARGCTSQCSFCAIHGFWTNSHNLNCVPWRSKSVKKIIDEIEYIVNTYHVNRFHFLDSSFENPFFNQERIFQIADEIMKRKLNISYYINIRASFHKIASQELMKKMIDSGLVNVFVGIESFYEDDLHFFNKSSNVEDGEIVLQVLQNYPINIDIGLINFHTKSTLNGLRKNAELLNKYKLSSRLLLLNRLMIYQGTPLYDYLKTENMIKGKYYELTNYKFADPKIETLNHFIFKTIQKDDINPLLTEMDLYEHRHITLIYHMKHYLKYLGDLESLEYVAEYEKKLNLLLTKLNEINTKWFLKLLELLENAWDEKEAIRIFSQYMNKESISKLLRQLKNDNLQLYRKLSIKNKNYLHQL